MVRESDPRKENAAWLPASPARSNRLGGVEDGELLLLLGRDEARTSSRRSRSRRQRLGVANRTSTAEGATSGAASIATSSTTSGASFLHSDSSKFQCWSAGPPGEILCQVDSNSPVWISDAASVARR